jgi:hypothetical protein
MTQPIAIVIAAALIAVAILVVNHWTLTASPSSQIMRLNRWTGTVEECLPLPIRAACQTVTP